MAINKSIFEFADKFGMESPFGEDWIAENELRRKEREKERKPLHEEQKKTQRKKDWDKASTLNFTEAIKSVTAKLKYKDDNPEEGAKTSREKAIEYITKHLIADLQDKSGLSLQIDKDDYLVIDKSMKQEQPKSQKLKDKLLSCITNEKKLTSEMLPIKISFSFSGELTSGNRGTIDIDVKEILARMRGTTKDLDVTAFGFALTFMHELEHTYLGEDMEKNVHSYSEQRIAGYRPQGRTVLITNEMQAELGSTYGQRLSYDWYTHPTAGGGGWPLKVLPYTTKAYEYLQKHQTNFDKDIILLTIGGTVAKSYRFRDDGPEDDFY